MDTQSYPLKQRPNGYWYFYIKQPGKAPQWKSTGTRDLEVARSLHTPTLSDLKQRFLDFLVHSKKSRKTYTLARRAFDLLIAHTHDAKLTQLTKSDILSFADACRQNLNEASVYCYWRALRHALSVARDWYPELTEIRVRWQSKGRPLPVVMDAAEVAVLLDTIRLPWLNAMVRLCLMTGLRLGEVCNLVWCDVDYVKRVVHVRTKADWSPKTTDDAVPLADDAMKLLQAIPHGCDANAVPVRYVFTSKSGGKLYLPHVSRVFKAQVKRSNLDNRIHFHTLRHTFATLLLRAGVGVYEVSKLMRHKSVKTTEIYLHVLGSELHESVNRLKL